MKKVYLLYYKEDVIKAFKTKHEAEEYIMEKENNSDYHIRSIKLEKIKPLTK